MTFVAAWKLKNEIFVTGDTAITIRLFHPVILQDKINYKAKRSSFYELHQYSQDKIIEEKHLKIYNIDNKYILGYAGDADIAFDIINEIYDQVKLKENKISEIVKNATLIYGGAVQLVIGYFENGETKLFTFNHDGKFEIKFHDTPVLIGKINAHEVLESFTPELINFINNNKLTSNPNDKLILFSTCLQSILIRANLIEHGIGGTFTGAYLNKKTFVWQKDTGYITFEMNDNVPANETSPNILYKNPRFIFLFHRNNRLATLSLNDRNEYRDIKLINHYINPSIARNQRDKFETEIKEWIKEYENLIVKQIKKIKLNYFVFFSYDTSTYNKITLVHNFWGSVYFVFDIYWHNGYPTLNMTKELVNDINPRKSESFNEFLWLTKKNVVWYIKNALIYLAKKIYYKIYNVKPKD